MSARHHPGRQFTLEQRPPAFLYRGKCTTHIFSPGSSPTASLRGGMAFSSHHAFQKRNAKGVGYRPRDPFGLVIAALAQTLRMQGYRHDTVGRLSTGCLPGPPKGKQSERISDRFLTAKLEPEHQIPDQPVVACARGRTCETGESPMTPAASPRIGLPGLTATTADRSSDPGNLQAARAAKQPAQRIKTRLDRKG